MMSFFNPLRPPPIRFVCACGAKVGVPRTFINSDTPAICPACLTTTWLVRPEKDSKVMAMKPSQGAREWLSLLNAEAGEALHQAKEILRKRRDKEQTERN